MPLSTTEENAISLQSIIARNAKKHPLLVAAAGTALVFLIIYFINKAK